MFIDIVTPDKKIFEGEVISATFPGTDGSFQILNNQIALPILLKKSLGDYQSIADGVVSIIS